MHQLATLWLDHLKTKEDRDHFSDTIYNHSNDIVLMKLYDIIKKKRQALEISERSTANYNAASWAYMQADNNGAIRSLKQLETLLEFVKETK